MRRCRVRVASLGCVGRERDGVRPAATSRARSDGLNVGRRRTFGSLLGVEADSGAIREGLVPVALDRAVMDEQVLAGVIRSDEPEALVVAEPFDGSCGHVCVSFGYVRSETRGCRCEQRAGETRGTAMIVARSRGVWSP